jgi:beta-aspartyl-peptidase (threonine type)
MLVILALASGLFLSPARAGDEVAALIARLGKDQPKEARLAAMLKLRDREATESLKAIPALRRCAQEKDLDIRARALATLGAIAFGNKQPCPIELVAALLDPDEPVYSTGYTYVGIFEKFPAEASPLLLRAMESEHPTVRQAVPTPLIAFAGKDPAAMAALRKAAASDKNLGVRNNAHVALWKVSKDLFVLVRFRLEVLGSVKRERENDSPEAQLERTHTNLIVIGSVMQLAEFATERPRELAEVLLKLVRDGSPVIRAMAARNLGVMARNNPRAWKILEKLKILEELERLREDAGPQVRVEAQLSLVPMLAAKTEAEAQDRAKKRIRDVLDDQVKAWNKRDLPGFMEGYWKSPDLSFYSGGKKTRGWQATLDRYRKQYQGEGKEMGTLAFSDLEIDVLDADHAVVRGRWQLTLAKEKVAGLFTLIFRKIGPDWRIVHDHTSK